MKDSQKAPNQITPANAGGAFGSALAGHVIGPAWLSSIVSPMFCEACHQRVATVHLTTTVHAGWLGQEPGTQREQHFCEQCADSYFSCTPGMNSARGLICLSDSYRARLYDLLEAVHPEAFNNTDAEACRRGKPKSKLANLALQPTAIPADAGGCG